MAKARQPKASKGRKSESALYVLLEAEEHERYKALAESLGMSMRDLVRAALDDYAAKMNTARTSATSGEPTWVGKPGSLVETEAAESSRELPVNPQKWITEFLEKARANARIDVDARTRVTALEEQVHELLQWKQKIESWTMYVGGKLGVNP